MRMTSAAYVPIVAAVLMACSDSTDVQLRGNVAVSFATRSAATPAAPPLPRAVTMASVLDDTLVSGSDTLIISRAEIVLREIELKRIETTTCESSPSGCDDIELGPILIDLPLNPGAVRQFEVLVESGTFDEIEFEIHKVSGDDPDDAMFRQRHPDFVDKSIRVRGLFGGQPFVFESDLDVEQELDLTPPLVVDITTATNITIRVDLASWFRTSSGSLIDPATANKGGINESVVKENIKRAIEAFEDDDEDGSGSD